MDRSHHNYPLVDLDRETLFHPNTSIADHLKKGPVIFSEARGVRIKDHFHAGQGTELLNFLGQIVEHRLDQCLESSGLGAVL